MKTHPLLELFKQNGTGILTNVGVYVLDLDENQERKTDDEQVAYAYASSFKKRWDFFNDEGLQGRQGIFNCKVALSLQEKSLGIVQLEITDYNANGFLHGSIHIDGEHCGTIDGTTINELVPRSAVFSSICMFPSRGK